MWLNYCCLSPRYHLVSLYLLRYCGGGVLLPLGWQILSLNRYNAIISDIRVELSRGVRTEEKQEPRAGRRMVGSLSQMVETMETITIYPFRDERGRVPYDSRDLLLASSSTANNGRL